LKTSPAVARTAGSSDERACCDAGVHDVGRERRRENAAQPLREEARETVRGGRRVEVELDGLEAGVRREDGRGNRDVPAAVEQCPEDADRRAAKRERIRRAGRHDVHGAGADERVEAVGDGDQSAGLAGRAGVLRAARHVVVGDDVRDGRRRPLCDGIGATHLALKLGELSDHQGDQIGLGESGAVQRGGADLRVEADVRSELRHQALDPPHLVPDGSQPLVEHDAV
jgi:hypothetical protein